MKPGTTKCAPKHRPRLHVERSPVGRENSVDLVCRAALRARDSILEGPSSVRHVPQAHLRAPGRSPTKIVSCELQ